MKELSKEFLEKELEEYKKDKSNAILRHALVKNSLNDVCSSDDAKINPEFNFDIEVKTRKAPAQNNTGRCWIFAACNMIRERIANELNIEEFEVSQSYLAFYDKLEKCNFFMEQMIEYIDKDYDDRTLLTLLDAGLRDGGQWDMVVNIINKYGLLPKNAYPDTYGANHSADSRNLLSFNLRKFCYEAKVLYKEKGLEAVKALKEDYLKKIYRLLISLYGVPTSEFTFEYTTKDGVCKKEKFNSPLEFKEKYLANYLDEFISVINLPTDTKPFNKVYETVYQGNVIEGERIKYLNVEMDRLKDLVITELKNNKIVWFGADVSFFNNRASGIWDDQAFDFDTACGLNFDLPKGESFNYRVSNISHAMCITGVALENEVPTKWKIENSWGTEIGNKGYFVMSSTWFDRFVYQAVINKKYLNSTELEAINSKPVMLEPWDILGN